MSKERKEEFRRIKRGLQDYKRWATEFPTGKELKLFEQAYIRGEPHDELLLLFRIWSHPNPTLEDAIEMASNVTVKNCERSGMILHGILRSEHSPKVDIVGGAAQALMDFFFPVVFVERTCADGVYGRRFMREMRPKLCLHGLSMWFCVTAYPNPQLIWPHRTEVLWTVDNAQLEKDSDLMDSFEGLCSLVMHFVPPTGLAGDELPHRELADRLRLEFEARQAELPELLRAAWERVQTRAGRSSQWEQLLYPDVEFSDLGEDGIIPYVAHDCDIDRSHFELVTSIFEELRILDSVDPIRAVDAGGLLHPKMVQRLGYPPGDPVPGYCMRLRTNAEFVDSDTARIDLDLLCVLAHPENVTERDVPAMLWITRPEKPWMGCVSARSYRSLARRTFEDRAQVPLYLYSCLGDGNPKKAADMDGSVRNPGHYPLANNRMPLLGDPQFDCPPWQGEPLPPFGG